MGICGTLMGSIALLAKAAGHRVSGTDNNVYPPMSDLLAASGISLSSPYNAENIPTDAELIIVGNANLPRGNPAVEHVLNSGIPYTSGAEWLGRYLLADKWVIAVSGTHGKTTTSAMIAWILEYAGMKPGFLIGGLPSNFSESARLGETPFFVIEADEYDSAFFDKRSKFVHYHPRTLVMNNLEFDHADIFDDLDHIKKHFHHLVRIIPEKGRIISNAQSKALDSVIKLGIWSELEFFNDDKGWSYQWVDDKNSIDILYRNKKQGSLDWELIGDHNASNALAAIAAANHIDIPISKSIEALKSFKGVKRRLEKIGEYKNNIKVYDDFAHHPSAIKSTLDGMKKMQKEGRIIAVIEPRSNTMKLGSMKKDLQDSLISADIIYCYNNNLDWDPSELFKNNQKVRVSNSTQWILDSIIEEKKANDQIVFMSNGGFSGIQNKCINLFENEK